MIQVRRSQKTLPPERVRELKALAVKIDREEGAEIRAQLRALRRETERLEGIFRQLQAERKRQGLSLSEVARRSGIDRARLSRLENEKYPNVTTDTIERYAEALHKQIVATLTDVAG